MADDRWAPFLPPRLPDGWSGRPLDLAKGFDMGKEWPVAKEDGEYVVDGAYYAMRKGEKYPPEAEIVGTQDAPDEERAKGEAPKNRAKPAAPENRGA